MQRDGHLFLTGLGLGLDGDLDNRIREDHAFEDDGSLFIAERIARRGFAQADNGGDVAGVNGVRFLTVVGVHAQDAAHALAFALGGVIDDAARLQHAAVYAEEHQLAYERVGHDLEREGAEGFAVARMADDFFRFVLGIHALNRRHVQRGGQIRDDGVEQRLHALVAIARTAEHRRAL